MLTADVYASPTGAVPSPLGLSGRRAPDRSTVPSKASARRSSSRMMRAFRPGRRRPVRPGNGGRGRRCEHGPKDFREDPGGRHDRVAPARRGTHSAPPRARGRRPRSRARPRGCRRHTSRRSASSFPQLGPERLASPPPEQHGRARRHRCRYHRHRSGWLPGHRSQRRAQRHQQERVRHRTNLAGGVHGRPLLAWR